MKNKKRRLPRKTRRKIFYACCTALLCIIIFACMRGCNNKNTEPLDVSAENMEAELVLENCRYDSIHIEAWELDEMAAIIYLEARNQSMKGQQAVAEVILNRVLYDGFPNSVSEVIHEGENKGVLQFTTVTKLSEAKPTAEQYKAINAALYGETVLPAEVVFFSKQGENKNVWGKIDDHVFCYAYKWE